MVKLLLDENLSPAVGLSLRMDGHDVVHVRDRGLLGVSDHEVLERAFREERVLVTANVADFLKLAAAREVHAGVAVLENGGLRRDEQLEVLRRVLERLGGQPDMVNRLPIVRLDGSLVLREVPEPSLGSGPSPFQAPHNCSAWGQRALPPPVDAPDRLGGPGRAGGAGVGAGQGSARRADEGGGPSPGRAMSADVDLLAWVLPAADRPERAEVRREARFEGADAATGLRTLETDGETLVVWSPRARPPEGVGRLTLWWAPDLGVSGAAEVVEASPDEAPGGGPRWRARLRPLDRGGELATSLRRALDQASAARVVSDEPLPAAAAAAQLAALCSRAAAGDVPGGPLDPAAAWDRIQALPDGVRAALASWSPVDGTTHRPCADDAVLLAALWALVEEGRERVRREDPDAPGDEVESLLLTAQDLFSDAAARRAIATGDSGAEKAAFAAARTLFLESALALRAAWSARAPERAAQVFPALRDAASYARADEAGPTRYAAGAFVRPDPRAWRARVWAAAEGRPGLARRVLGSLGATAALGALGAALLHGETLDARLHPASAPIPPEELAAVSSVLSRAERSEGGHGSLVIATAGPAWTSMTTDRRLREARRIGAALGRTGVSSAYVYDETGKLLVTFGGNGPRLAR